jgi:hypothetical protein
MKKTDLIKITNRDNSRVGYYIPEMGVRRQFMPRETKEISFEELQNLYFVAGGRELLESYLIIKDEKAIKELGMDVEPEYFYSEEDVKNILTKGTLNEFLDCLDFAPDGVLEMIKDLSVSLPLDNMSKREAILNKLNFNVTKAIEIRNTKFDGGDEDEVAKPKRAKRRTSAPEVHTESGRRTETPVYKKI